MAPPTPTKKGTAEKRPPTPTKKGAADKKKKGEIPKGQMLMSQFVRKIAPPQTRILEGSNVVSEIFSSYEIQSGVYLAPTLRVCPPSPSRLQKLLNRDQDDIGFDKESLYLSELKKRQGKKSAATVRKDDGNNTVELVEATPEKAQKPMKVKLIQFSENNRPPYYGTMRKKSKTIRPRNPFKPDSDLLDYEVDSDDEWAEEQAAENVDEADNEEEESEEDADEEGVDDFIEDDENELNQSRGVDMIEEDEELKPIRPSVESWLKQRKVVRLRKRIVGPFWRNHEEQCPNILKRLAIIPLADFSKKKDKKNDENDSISEKCFGNNKIPESLMPLLIQLTHGSTAAVAKIATAFLDLLDVTSSTELTAKFSSVDISVLEVINNTPREKLIKKNTVMNIIKKIADYIEPPLLEKAQKRCWYIREDVRTHYKVLEGICLPNPSAFAPPAPERDGNKRKLSSATVTPSQEEKRSKQARVESPELLPGFKQLFGNGTAVTAE
ncbi:hypothetical protein RvY_09145 [Ramazzottius varieornatus]|uniref:Chromatin assembly factor 1 subunit A dimerization domain-containing protein n=1 Tax=Ramazzottius varieornatus TaxID=947166 RepID=A0A1D1VDW1_RAMVA|nr:hypothetical protein RvY_09145 [Ramazzottius varieornatus]